MDFKKGVWQKEINVRDFIVANYTPYDGDDSFLAAPTKNTEKLWNEVADLMKEERARGGVYDIDEKTISTVSSHKPGYIDSELETIVGLQTDAPLKRAIMPFGGIRMVRSSLETYGKKMDPEVENVFKYRKTHNDGVFDAYTDEMKLARHTGIITGLPDAYGRGRIIGDYRRVALYGVDKLIEEKEHAKKNLIFDIMDSPTIRLREEISEQIRSLKELAYDELFSGDPTWITESIGGMCLDGRHMVTKMSYRFLHTLTNLGPAPEPNMTVLWSTRLPENFKRFCSKVSIKTSSIQYENDDLMIQKFGDDYGIACCVSAMRIGKQMQFFGARANLAKALLYALNGCKDERYGVQCGPMLAPVTSEYLDYEEVTAKFDAVCEWLSKLYISTLNIIHYMHDKYCYEKIQMALHDEDILRTSACGLAGLSVVADSLSAIKYAKVKPIRNEAGLIVDFDIEGDYPKFGNNDERVDEIAVEVVRKFMDKLSRHKTYRDSKPTMSILTITSNVVYGKKTGSTPDGRKAGEPFAPGANPKSVAKLPYDYSEDGISYTFSIIPGALGKELDQQETNHFNLLDGYFEEEGHHINVNVIDREVLLDAMEHPELYPQLTIRVSGYAVNFIKLTREQQLDVINRTFHERF